MNYLELFEQVEIDMILKALGDMERKHTGIYKRTIDAGYGKATTIEKAKMHQLIAENYAALESKIAENLN